MAQPRRRPPPASGRHLLRSAELARQFVLSAGVDRSHLILEIGGGTGVLTQALAEQAASVTTIEIDPPSAERLRQRFAGYHHVTVVERDAMQVALPSDPFRVLANIPFARTTAILHKLLDDPGCPLLRADLIVQLGAALKRTRDRNLLNAAWGPWYGFRLIRSLPRTCFRPPPSVDAAHLAIVRRRVPLVPDERRDDYVRMLRHAFTPSCGPLHVELADWLSKRALGPLAEARATDLELKDWVRVSTEARTRTRSDARHPIR